MELSAALLITLNDLLVCLLPLIFFRRDGQFTPMWFVTAAPYAVAPLITWGIFLGYLQSSIHYLPALAVLGVVLSTLSILMMGLTLGCHRVPLALWHQHPDRDAPQYIVDWGIYRLIRHPFYSSFIVLMIANSLIAQSVWALAVLTYVATVLTFTAKKEERRLSSEPDKIGEHYRSYMQSSGRFFPRLG